MFTLLSNWFGMILGSVVMAWFSVVHIFVPVPEPTSVVPVMTVPAEEQVATTSPPVAASTTPSKPKPAPVAPPKAIPPVVVTPPAPIPTIPAVPVGPTTIVVWTIPLLAGGTVHAGQTFPVSYLQITNTGKASAHINGFWLIQTGSAPVSALIGLSVVDDQGGSRGQVGGTEGSSPFKEYVALAPTDAYFAPGQQRLFTIKAAMTAKTSSILGTKVTLDVSSVETAATVEGQFPIRGVTWTIVQ